jgi:hypothetical protein
VRRTHRYAREAPSLGALHDGARRGLRLPAQERKGRAGLRWNARGQRNTAGRGCESKTCGRAARTLAPMRSARGGRQIPSPRGAPGPEVRGAPYTKRAHVPITAVSRSVPGTPAIGSDHSSRPRAASRRARHLRRLVCIAALQSCAMRAWVRLEADPRAARGERPVEDTLGTPMMYHGLGAECTA